MGVTREAVFPRPGTGDTFVPGQHVEFSPNGVQWFGPDTVDSDNGEDVIPGALGFLRTWPGLDDPMMLARFSAAMAVVERFHEVMEFTRVDGVRLADPHPGYPAEPSMWPWLMDSMLKLVDEYASRYPTED